MQFDLLEIGFHIDQWMFQKFFKAFFVGFKGHSTVHEDFQIRPDIMDRGYPVVFDYFFHQNLKPCWHPYDNPNIPILRSSCDFIQFISPVRRFSYFLPWLVKVLKPKWYLCGSDPTQVSFEIGTTLPEVCTPAKH